MEIVIEFGGAIGAPYGRDQYTRMGHIEILGYDDIDYGLNSNGALWTTSSTYGGYSAITTSSIGDLEPKSTLHHMNNAGLKWYKCSLSITRPIKSITAYSSYASVINGDAASYYIDFPGNVKISIMYNGIIQKTVADKFNYPTARGQRNKTIDIDYEGWYKNFIKSNNQIFRFDDNEWIATQLFEPIRYEDYQKYGIIELDQIIKHSKKVLHLMRNDRSIGNGKVVKKAIEVMKFNNKINSIEVR